MKALSNFQNSSKINIGSIWGGTKASVCWTQQTDKGASTDPCGNKDDINYMAQD
jgi:hypothetical protein